MRVSNSSVLGRYLARLDMPSSSRSVEALHALHRAHLEHIPYETIDIHLGRRTSISPVRVAARLGSGSRGGYCFHLNGAFSWLLSALGYQVTGHRANVRLDSGAAEPLLGNHLALVVHGLPTPAHPRGAWLVDVGLGTGPRDPLPLVPGEHRQGAFTYFLEAAPLRHGGWRLRHDTAHGPALIDIRTEPARPVDLLARHRYLSTDPRSPYQRVLTAQRRTADHVNLLRGCALTRLDGGVGAEQLLESRREWFAALADVFGITLEDLTATERDLLWRRTIDTHHRWLNAIRHPA